MEGDPLLFGVQPKNIMWSELRVSPALHGRPGEVLFVVQTLEHRRPMVLRVDDVAPDRMAGVVGQFLPLVIQSHHVGAGTLRRHMWATSRRLCNQGEEVALSGCGKPITA